MSKRKKLSVAQRFALASKAIAEAQGRALRLRELEKENEKLKIEIKGLRALETWVEDTGMLEDSRLKHFTQLDYDLLFLAENEDDFYQRASAVAGRLNMQVREVYTLWLSP